MEKSHLLGIENSLKVAVQKSDRVEQTSTVTLKAVPYKQELMIFAGSILTGGLLQLIAQGG